MNLLNLETEAAALAGYTIGSTGQDLTNKIRAARRVNIVGADITSRFAGKWPINYREAWLPIVPLYVTGTITATLASQTVTGSGTSWTTAMKGYKILLPDGAYYKISSVTSATTLVLSQPFQGTTASAQTYQIWKDEYRLYPEVLSIGGFIDYFLPQVSKEVYSRDMQSSYPKETSPQEPTVHTIVGAERYVTAYSTGTLSGTINSNVLTGVGTLWLANVEPGFEITIGVYTYHVLRVNSDTEIELYQQLVIAASGAAYSTKGKNAMVVRFRSPTTQRVVKYWYWSKYYPLINDGDEDWIAESFPRVITDGMAYFDYLDKNDVPRAMNSRTIFENSIKDMRVSVDGAFTGTRTLPLEIPDSARD